MKRLDWKGFLAGLAVAGLIFIGYHAIGTHRAIWVNREALQQLNKRLAAIEQIVPPPKRQE